MSIDNSIKYINQRISEWEYYGEYSTLIPHLNALIAECVRLNKGWEEANHERMTTVTKLTIERNDAQHETEIVQAKLEESEAAYRLARQTSQNTAHINTNYQEKLYEAQDKITELEAELTRVRAQRDGYADVIQSLTLERGPLADQLHETREVLRPFAELYKYTTPEQRADDNHHLGGFVRVGDLRRAREQFNE